MSIESDFKAMNINLGRIATALEGLLAEQGVVVDAEAVPTKKKGTNKKKSNKTVVGKPKEESTSEFTFDDVRTKLKLLKAEVSQAAVKSLLKKYGASTIGQVDEKHYARLIADVDAELE